jgi:hypothetical protein
LFILRQNLDANPRSSQNSSYWWWPESLKLPYEMASLSQPICNKKGVYPQDGDVKDEVLDLLSQNWPNLIHSRVFQGNHCLCDSSFNLAQTPNDGRNHKGLVWVATSKTIADSLQTQIKFLMISFYSCLFVQFMQNS